MLMVMVMINLCLVILTYNCVYAQSIGDIMFQQRLIGKTPQIPVGSSPTDIAINTKTNKIYVVNGESNSVSIINSNFGNEAKNIRVGTNPSSIAVDDFNNRIYVANSGSDTISVIDGDNDTRIRDISVGKVPRDIIVGTSFDIETGAINAGNVYVSNSESNSVSVIDSSTELKLPDIHIWLNYIIKFM